MNTRQIEYIITIAEEKSISKAAEKLYIAQSSLSQALLNLEKELGVPLFSRTKKELLPTPAGLLYVQGAKKMLSIKNEVYDGIQKQSAPRDVYRVGISFHKGMQRALIAASTFQKRYLNMNLYAIEEQPQNLIQMLKQNQLDFAIITLDSLSITELPYRTFHQEEILIGFPVAWKEQLLQPDCAPDLTTLSRQKFIISKPGTTMRTISQAIFKRLAVHVPITMETNSMDIILHTIAKEGFWSFIPQGFAKPREGIAYCSLDPNVYRYQMVMYTENTQRDDVKMKYVDMVADVVLEEDFSQAQ